MNRRGAGVLFLITGSILFVVRHINPDRIAFGQTGFVVSIILLLVGIGYLAWGELTDE